MSIAKDSLTYTVTGTYYVPTNDNLNGGPYSTNRKLISLPATIATCAGIITISSNYEHSFKNVDVLNISILSPRVASNKYANELQATQTTRLTSIMQLQFTNEVPWCSPSYLKQLATVYNHQANGDRNTITLHIDKSISDRLDKANTKLDRTEGQLQNYKQQNGTVELRMSAGNSVANQNNSELKLVEVETQVKLFNTIAREAESSSHNLPQVIPFSVGLDDQSPTPLIDKYNELVLKRNRLLRSASKSSPVVESLTVQIRELNGNIRRAIGAACQNLQIQHDAVLS